MTDPKTNMVTPSIPTPIESGMVNIRLNPRGQLIELAAVPPQVEEPAHSSPPPGWLALFTAAGLDMTRFSASDPRWFPLSHFDAHAAWNGFYPGSTIPLKRGRAAAQVDARSTFGALVRG